MQNFKFADYGDPLCPSVKVFYDDCHKKSPSTPHPLTTEQMNVWTAGNLQKGLLLSTAGVKLDFLLK